MWSEMWSEMSREAFPFVESDETCRRRESPTVPLHSPGRFRCGSVRMAAGLVASLSWRLSVGTVGTIYCTVLFVYICYIYIYHTCRDRVIDRSKSIDRSIQIKVAACSVSIALRKRQAHLELAMSGDVRPTATTLYRVAQESWSGKRVLHDVFDLFTASCFAFVA